MNRFLKARVGGFAAVLLLLFFCAPGHGFAQGGQPAAAYPAHLPYSFSNFVWWSDEELRALLKKRIPGLGDEIATTTAAEGRVRVALTALLKEKGIAAEVQSEEPSSSLLTAERVAEAPRPSILFSIRNPAVVVEKVILSGAPEAAAAALKERLERGEGRPYSGLGDWAIRWDVEEELGKHGYLRPKIAIAHDAPRRDGDRYLVNRMVEVTPGPQYEIVAMSADGGPLTAGQDLTPYFMNEVGKIAAPEPFHRLEGHLRTVYWENGYADVEFKTEPRFEDERAAVSYRLDVVPGPVYHLRSVTVTKLNGAQEKRVRELLPMKAGDLFRENAIDALYRGIAQEPLLKGYGFTFTPKRDKAAGMVDLSLDFYKQGEESGVFIQ